MSEHDRETAFLKEMLTHGPRSEVSTLQQCLHKAEREEKCARCALKRVMQLTAVAGFGFLTTGYSLPHISTELLDPLARVFFLLAVTAGLSTVLFAWAWGTAREELNFEREKCRLLIKSGIDFGPPSELTSQWTVEPVRVSVSVEERQNVTESENETKYLSFPKSTGEGRDPGVKPVMHNVSRAAAS